MIHTDFGMKWTSRTDLSSKLLQWRSAAGGEDELCSGILSPCWKWTEMIVLSPGQSPGALELCSKWQKKLLLYRKSEIRFVASCASRALDLPSSRLQSFNSGSRDVSRPRANKTHESIWIIGAELLIEPLGFQNPVSAFWLEFDPHIAPSPWNLNLHSKTRHLIYCGRDLETRNYFSQNFFFARSLSSSRDAFLRVSADFLSVQICPSSSRSLQRVF